VLLLVSGATSTVHSILDARLGYFCVPGAWGYPSERRPWAGDNGAFTGFDAEAFLAMLDKLRGRPGCLFIAAPDVVADATKTLARFDRWALVIRAFGFPVALVAQDGLTPQTIPWSKFDALFIGGTTAWKLGGSARTLAAYAKARGKWVHMGRVNSKRRLLYAERIGCDSVDGSGFSKWPFKTIPQALRWLTAHEQQPGLSI
jgi:hypothetical protein